MKKWQTPKDVYNKDDDQARCIIWCLSLSSQACFTHFDMRIFDYKTSQLLSLIIFGRPSNLPSGDMWELTQIFDLINCR